MKLIECESRNSGSKLIQVLPFSINNYKNLKSSDNLVFLVDNDKEIKENFEYNYFDELEYAYNSNTLFYQILFNCETYSKDEIEYLLTQINFNDISTYIYQDVVEEYFYIDDILSNNYIKDKVNIDILKKIIEC